LVIVAAAAAVAGIEMELADGGIPDEVDNGVAPPPPTPGTTTKSSTGGNG
jgi:hypothetical protein